MLNIFELKDDGFYINGTRVDAIKKLVISSDVDALTELTITCYGKLHNLDDLKPTEHKFQR